MKHASTVAVCLLRPQCEGQNTFQESDMPARSRLYSLAPYKIETVWRESLTGYINRLGWTHHISPRAFVAEMILPPLTKDLGLRLPAAAAFGADGAMSFNGTGDLASAGGALLNHLTMRTDSLSASPVDVSHRHPLSSPPKPTDGSMSVLSEAPDDPCYQQHTTWRMYLMWHIPWRRSKKLRWRTRA